MKMKGNAMRTTINEANKKKIISSMDSFGYTENYDYDKNGRLLKMTNSNGDSWIHEYNDDDNTENIIAPNGLITVYIDGLEEPFKLIKPDGTETIYNYEFDDNGNITKQSINGKTIYTHKYDDNGNMISCIFAGCSEALYEYDEKDRITKYTTRDYTEICTYDGNYIYVVDEEGNKIRTIELDDEGNQIKTIREDDGLIIIYDYDDEGNMIHMKNSSGYEYWAVYTII
jgi:YD repeat-containing protein